MEEKINNTNNYNTTNKDDTFDTTITQKQEDTSRIDSKNTSFDEIVLKPSVIPELLRTLVILMVIAFVGLVGLVVASILDIVEVFLGVVSFGALIILGPVIIGVIFSIINLLVTSYHITNNNELIIKRELLSKTSKVYRIDQITTISRSQSFIQRIFGLHTIDFNIFGGVGLENTGVSQNSVPILPQFDHIKNGEHILKEITSKMNIEYQESQYTEEPRVLPQVVRSIWNFIVGLFFLILVFFSEQIANFTQLTTINEYGVLIVQLVLLVMFFIYVLATLASIIGIFRLQKTSYELFEESSHLKYRYFFSNMHKITPYKKITNVSEYRSLLSYLLFKVKSIVLYTGGNVDPAYIYVSKNSSLVPILSEIVKSPANKLNAQILSRILENTHKEESITLKPGISFIIPKIITAIIYTSIFVVSLIIASSYLEDSLLRTFVVLGSLLGIVKSILYIIYKWIEWRMYTYELFSNKIIVTYGVFSIVQSEIYLSNIKYVKLKETLLQRIFSQGTIYIFTAGKTGHDSFLRNIDKSKYYYNDLKEAIIKKNY